MPDIREMTDNEIFEELAGLGVVTSLEKFRDDAMDVGTPTSLADEWIDLFNIIEQEAEDFIYEAAFELWRRHLSDVNCPEISAAFIDETLDMYMEHPEEHDSAFLLGIYGRIKQFYLNLLSEDGSPAIDFYNEVTWHAHNDFEEFLLSLPHDLAGQGLADEAADIDIWFADFSTRPGDFLRDAACILAEAGRKEDALAQIDENLRRFPTDLWVVINAGDAMRSLGETKSAEDLFLRARDMAAEKYDRLGVLERLLEFYKEMGRPEKAAAIEAEYKALSVQQ